MDNYEEETLKEIELDYNMKILGNLLKDILYRKKKKIRPNFFGDRYFKDYPKVREKFLYFPYKGYKYKYKFLLLVHTRKYLKFYENFVLLNDKKYKYNIIFNYNTYHFVFNRRFLYIFRFWGTSFHLIYYRKANRKEYKILKKYKPKIYDNKNQLSPEEFKKLLNDMWG